MTSPNSKAAGAKPPPKATPPQGGKLLLNRPVRIEELRVQPLFWADSVDHGVRMCPRIHRGGDSVEYGGADLETKLDPFDFASLRLMIRQDLKQLLEAMYSRPAEFSADFVAAQFARLTFLHSGASEAKKRLRASE